jgi:hypothetical protein
MTCRLLAGCLQDGKGVVYKNEDWNIPVKDQKVQKHQGQCTDGNRGRQGLKVGLSGAGHYDDICQAGNRRKLPLPKTNPTLPMVKATPISQSIPVMMLLHQRYLTYRL